MEELLGVVDKVGEQFLGDEDKARTLLDFLSGSPGKTGG